MHRILIVDDDPDLRRSLRSAFEDQCEVAEAENGQAALALLNQKEIDLVILDMDMPGLGGMDTLRAIKQKDSRIIVLILTAYSSVPDAVTAIQAGAFNYLAKPIRHEEIRSMVEKALAAHHMVTQVAYSAPFLKGEVSSKLTSQSGQMKKIFHLVERVATVDTAVLLRGESGTGKEVVARAIHANSLRKEGRFVPVNCSAIPETLIESELFGHEKGAFTGAEQRKIGKFQYADGGTIFLDEVGDITAAMQVKLLRVLQEKRFMPVGSNLEVQVNVRIIAATNRNLEEMLEKGSMREDFYYRLNVLPIFLPPLRERKEDLEVLVQYFIRKFNAAHQKTVQGIDVRALERLWQYSWPGNIRELGNVIEHAFVMETSSVLTEFSLPEKLCPVEVGAELVSQVGQATSHSADEWDFRSYKERLEREFIVRALRRFHGKINQTSVQTNIPKKTLLRKIEKYGIRTEDFRK